MSKDMLFNSFVLYNNYLWLTYFILDIGLGDVVPM